MSAAEKPSMDAFARIVMEAFRRSNPGVELTYDPVQQCIYKSGDPDEFFYLANSFAEFSQADPSERPRHLERMLSAWQAARPDLGVGADMLPNLRPVIRLRSYFELMRMQIHARTGQEPLEFPYRVLGEHYGLGMMFLTGSAMAVVAFPHLREWGIDFDAAMVVAMQNLQQRTKTPLRQFAPGVWWGQWKDDFGPSRLLLTDLIRQYEVQGDPVAVLAERRVLLLTGSEDPNGLLLVAQAAENLGKDGRPVGRLPLRLRGDNWEAYLPPASHPSGVRHRQRWMNSEQGSYNEQAGYLAQIMPDVKTAEYHAFPGRQGIGPFSFCIWVQGSGPTLLPRTERVLFALPDEDGGEPNVRAEVSWGTAQRVVGSLMKREEGMYPERWRVETFPDALQLAGLRTGG